MQGVHSSKDIYRSYVFFFVCFSTPWKTPWKRGPQWKQEVGKKLLVKLEVIKPFLPITIIMVQWKITTKLKDILEKKTFSTELWWEEE